MTASVQIIRVKPWRLYTYVEVFVHVALCHSKTVVGEIHPERGRGRGRERDSSTEGKRYCCTI